LSEIGHEQVILGDDFTGQMTQPTVSEHRRTSTSRTNPSRLSSVKGIVHSLTKNIHIAPKI